MTNEEVLLDAEQIARDATKSHEAFENEIMLLQNEFNSLATQEPEIGELKDFEGDFRAGIADRRLRRQWLKRVCYIAYLIDEYDKTSQGLEALIKQTNLEIEIMKLQLS